MEHEVTKRQHHDIVNGLRVDLHEPDCKGMDADGNWLGDCDCAEQHHGMPSIIWADAAADRWIEALDQLGENGRSVGAGYTVRVKVKENPLTEEWETHEGTVVSADRAENSSGWPRLTLRRWAGGTIILLADEIESVYVY